MEKLDNICVNLKVVSHSILFEVKLQKKKFFIFSIITIVLFFLNSIVSYVIISFMTLPYSQIDFYQSLIVSFMTILFLTTGFFFSGIICTEYKKKTGLTLLPLIEKHNLIIGKYIANYILVIGIAAIQYFLMALLTFYFYAEPLPPSLFLSFGFTVFYILAISSMVSFFSSFMKSATLTTTITLILLLFGFGIIDTFFMLAAPKIEPIYSLNYVRNIITYILRADFFTMQRYMDFQFEGTFIFRSWLTPTMQGALFVLSLYTIVFFLFGSLLFKRRQI